ncbi:MAG: hypothetical protein O2925_01680 [Actinomycetota bacterium]|nr:hypothetical protein [Actinomycetota bacterium]MDA3027483.1 hypothetical protein [Actinomycetota bacterium]
MTLERNVSLPAAAASSIEQIIGIMLDSFMAGGDPSTGRGAFAWGIDIEQVVDLEQRMRDVWSPEELSRGEGPDRSIELSIEDVTLVLQGMAFTEVMSAELPWVDMVRWTSDFVTAELRQHWNDDEWSSFNGS